MRFLSLLAAAWLLLAVPPASAQQPDSAVWAAIREASAEDHQRMMEALGIEELRPGPSGDPLAPNAANTDESQVAPYPLPDPLVTHDGERVTTAEAWWQVRRPEIVEAFDREMYGRVPEDVPGVTWEVERRTRQMEGGIPVVVKDLAGRVDNAAYPALDVTIDMKLVTPAEADGPVPVMVHFGFNWPAGFSPPSPEGLSWQEQLLQRGWGYATLVPTSYQADHGAGLTEGIIGLTNHGQPRDPDDWGALRAWAWGASRALDYLETDPAVDASQVGIEGLSRYGKAALVAMAYEPRFDIGFIGSSGAGGASLLRRNFGEQVENLASSYEYHWFAGNFIRYAGPLTADDLPVDAHELVALAAPRPVFISVGAPDVEGEWVDARGMFLAGVHAGPVYRLLGADGLGTDVMPPQVTGLLDGEVAFRQHEGGHTTGPNWPYFLDYAEHYVEPRSSDDDWAGTWSTSVQLTEPRNLPPVPLAGNTLRQVVRVSQGGERLRVQFSNAFGTAPVTLQAAHLAVSRGDGAIDPATDQPLTFGGEPGVTIPAGEAVTTDPFAFPLQPLTDVAITTHFGEVSADTLTGHPGSRTTSYIVEGDAVAAPAMPDAARTGHWYVISGIDVAREDVETVVVLGNSITDGRGSGTNRQNRWPDVLAARLQADERTDHVAVVNAGIGGNCVLKACLGPSALDRFERDVLDEQGAEWLVVLEGINDIGGSDPDSSAAVAQRLIDAYQQMLRRAHARGIEVYGATLLPFGESFYDAPEHEAARQTVNAWIRTSDAFDAVIDLDAALRDPDNPTRLLREADTGDHLHPNETGHRMMGEAVDLRLFAE